MRLRSYVLCAGMSMRPHLDRLPIAAAAVEELPRVRRRPIDQLVGVCESIGVNAQRARRRKHDQVHRIAVTVACARAEPRPNG